MADPFAVLGVAPTASLAEVRAARRRLAKELHPDRGGDEARMREVNRAFDLAVKAVRNRTRPVPAGAASARGAGAAGASPSPAPPPAPPVMRLGVERDEPSFTVDVLPAEAFEALLVVASGIGEVLVDDPPYVLDVHLSEPAPCWCRLELLPEAGGTTVILTVGGVGGAPHPPVEDVRDVWVAKLNRLGAVG